MNDIKLLDCTLRDGGYINDWEFGQETIGNTIELLEDSKVDIIELGFLKDEPYSFDRTVFSSISQITGLLQNKREHVQYAAMIEVVNPIPLEKLQRRTEETIDIIRVIVWKTRRDSCGNEVDALQEGYEYCKGVVERGYKLCVQPARVDQYTDEEFVSMLLLFQQLNPMAIYVVDSWGTLTIEGVMHYAKLADATLNKEIAIGYHGHNNLLQAYGAATVFSEQMQGRDTIVDASVYGMGRGAGNLNLELFAQFLNESRGSKYNISKMLQVYDKYIRAIYERTPWGYSLPHFVTARKRCNPNYGNYYGNELGLSAYNIENILNMLSEKDKIIFKRETAEAYYHEYIGAK